MSVISQLPILNPYYLNYNSHTTIDKTIQNYRKELSKQANNSPAVLTVFDDFTECLKLHSLNTDREFPLSKVLDALHFAGDKHLNQIRKDAASTPYIIHPIGVALSVWKEGNIRDPNTIIAALLHDTLEDTETTKEELDKRFGSQVSEIVLQLSNPPGLSSQQSKEWQIKHAPSLSPEAKNIKLADRLYNVRDLRTPPVNWTKEKVRDYYGWGEKLLNVLQGTNPALENLLGREIVDHVGPTSRL